MEIRHCIITVWQYSRESPALYRRRSSVLVGPACDMSSLTPCLHEEADTRMLASLGVKSNCLAFFTSTHRVRYNILSPGWVSFPAVTGYFVKMTSLPEKLPTEYLCTIGQFIALL